MPKRMGTMEISWVKTLSRTTRQWVQVSKTSFKLKLRRLRKLQAERRRRRSQRQKTMVFRAHEVAESFAQLRVSCSRCMSNALRKSLRSLTSSMKSCASFVARSMQRVENARKSSLSLNAAFARKSIIIPVWELDLNLRSEHQGGFVDGIVVNVVGVVLPLVAVCSCIVSGVQAHCATIVSHPISEELHQMRSFGRICRRRIGI
mmetsp:Transcript_54805/g.86738  ORF Transcript_54805/g.86738 Transcript_54805/m.86738 type:complete len:204 (+) Transcript_54805:341-952(+)